MFAGLDVDGDDDDDDDDDEPTPPPQVVQKRTTATLLPEASNGEDDDDDDDEPPKPRAKSAGSAVLGGIDPEDLEITIETLRAVAADLTLFRSRPFKELREALGPLATELIGKGGGGGSGGGGGGGDGAVAQHAPAQSGTAEGGAVAPPAVQYGATCPSCRRTLRVTAPPNAREAAALFRCPGCETVFKVALHDSFNEIE